MKMKGTILSMYKNVLICRESIPYYEPKNSRTPYSFHPGAFTFLYIAINKQEKENKKKNTLPSILRPSILRRGFILDDTLL